MDDIPVSIIYLLRIFINYSYNDEVCWYDESLQRHQWFVMK